MADTQPPRVDNEIVQMWRRDGRLYAIAGFIAGVMLFPLLASLSENLVGFLQELAPEAVGILVTVFLIDRIIRRRDERSAEAALKQQLILEAGSSINEKARDAVHQLGRNMWIGDEHSVLKGANLRFANLDKARLYGSHLDGVNLFKAQLNGARLSFAHLNNANLFYAHLNGAELDSAYMNDADLCGAQLNNADMLGTQLKNALLINAHLENASLAGAHLTGADMRGAYLNGVFLRGANLDGANLRSANLKDADLRSANLTGADLRFANLQNVNFEEAKFDKQTWLPDETYWSPETDMTRFADPNYPNFWRSDNPDSPAYRGKPEA